MQHYQKKLHCSWSQLCLSKGFTSRWSPESNPRIEYHCIPVSQPSCASLPQENGSHHPTWGQGLPSTEYVMSNKLSCSKVPCYSRPKIMNNTIKSETPVKSTTWETTSVLIPRVHSPLTGHNREQQLKRKLCLVNPLKSCKPTLWEI